MAPHQQPASPNQQQPVYFSKGFVETTERLVRFREARNSVVAWNTAHQKTHPGLKQNSPDDQYEMALADTWRTARAEAWYYSPDPVLCILPESGVPTDTIQAALEGVYRFNDYGVPFRTRIITKPDRVTELFCKDKSKNIMPELERLCMDGEYRPGIMVLLNREIKKREKDGDAGPQGVVGPAGILIAEQSPVVQIDLLVSHELVHYLHLDGRKPADPRFGHCTAEPCLMNVDDTTPRLCNHHQATFHGYHEGTMHALQREGILPVEQSA